MKLLLLLTALLSLTNAVDTFGARYSVEFESYFCDLTRFNYPASCPENPHTSPMFGGAHNDAFHLWELGEIATNGIKNIAETGDKSLAESEWITHVGAGHALSSVSSAGINGVGSTTFEVQVDRDHSLLSFASMLAPSPDWFVGVDSQEMWDNVDNCWKQTLEVDLNALDSGTDAHSPTLAGTYPDPFTRPNDPIVPPNPIALASQTHAVWRETIGIIGKLKFTFISGHEAPTPVPSPTASRTPVVFTFAFDDTFKDGLSMARYLEECDWHGTFYISSLRLCLHPDYLSREDVNGLFLRGHQIGGHTLSHQQMFDLDETAMNLQVCCNRQLLREYKWGPTAFAYPFAQYNHTIRRAVQKCGYCNARSTSDGLKSERCPTCDAAESIPPADKWRMRSYSVLTTDTFEILKQRIDDALASDMSSKWLIFNFHKLCGKVGDRCNTRYRYSTLKSDFANLVLYLKDLQSKGLVEVKTVKEVMHAFNVQLQSIPRSFRISLQSEELSLFDGQPNSASAFTFTSAAMILALISVILF